MRETYERSNKTLEAAVQSLEKSFDAAVQGAAAQRLIIIDIAQKNLNLGFDLAKNLAGASSLSEILQLQAAYWRKQFDAFATQAEEVRGGAKPEAVETSPEPIQHEPAKEAPPPAQEARVSAAEGGTQKPEARPGLVAPPAVRPPDEKQSATPTEGAPQDQALQEGIPAEIKFGMLDGNAVRFTSREAWWLVDGVWRPISPGEVLLNAAVMREARYDQFFPEVPPLPSHAFQADNLKI